MKVYRGMTASPPRMGITADRRSVFLQFFPPIRNHGYLPPIHRHRTLISLPELIAMRVEWLSLLPLKDSLRSTVSLSASLLQRWSHGRQAIAAGQFQDPAEVTEAVRPQPQFRVAAVCARPLLLTDTTPGSFCRRVFFIGVRFRFSRGYGPTNRKLQDTPASAHQARA